MAQDHVKRLDQLILQLVKINNTVRRNPEIEFDIDHLLPIVETAINAVAEEIDEEMEG